MNFVVRTPRDLVWHSQNLLREHVQLLQRGGKGTKALFNKLGDAAVEQNLDTMKPPDIVRTVSHFSKARVVHARLLEKLFSIASRRVSEFRPNEVADLLLSMRYMNWKISDQKAGLLCDMVITKHKSFSLSQTSEVLFTLSLMRYYSAELYNKLGAHVLKLDPLVGWHMTAPDVTRLLRAHASASQRNTNLMSTLAYRLSAQVGCAPVKTVTDALWAFATLQYSNKDFNVLVMKRLRELLADKEEFREAQAAPLMWAIVTLQLDEGIVPHIAQAVHLRSCSSWNLSLMLWSVAQIDASHSAPLSGFVTDTCTQLKHRYDFDGLIPANVTWALSILKHRDEELLNAIVSYLAENNWQSLSNYTERRLVDLMASYAEVQVASDTLQMEIAQRLHHKRKVPQNMARFAWALASSRAANSKKLFKLVSLWSREQNGELSVEELSNIVWAASTLSVDKKLQHHFSKMLENL